MIKCPCCMQELSDTALLNALDRICESDASAEFVLRGNAVAERGWCVGREARHTAVSLRGRYDIRSAIRCLLQAHNSNGWPVTQE